MLRDVISVGRLVEARRRALRRGVWFRILGGKERSIVFLTIRCLDRIRSAKLAKIVTTILIKLKVALESRVKRLVRTKGRLMAQRVSRIAQEWRNRYASKWAWDPGFMQYLTIMQMSTPWTAAIPVIGGEHLD